MLDDGWFSSRRNDRSGLGDWWVSTEQYPDGLAPLIDLVESLGMEFGIWVEPEMVNPDSDLFRAHPEWALTTPGYVSGALLVFIWTFADFVTPLVVGVQAFINMSVVLGLMPTKGIPLPLVSAGGSSLLINLVGVGMLGITPTQYWQQTLYYASTTQFALGILKAGVFGVLVALAGCLRGMECGDSASAVGDAATSAVVTSIVLIVVAVLCCCCVITGVILYTFGDQIFGTDFMNQFNRLLINAVA